ncbi:helicase C-terminal domain-containing protein [Streptomyces sp. JJ66]|uniref:helicase C-terminal domain-containing protein n=1 Tax=Streptomyces sp. JJ66 TaxID=2803843 RepID=UPI001C570447|nr:helicase C-terminal domain-containing protein [Streptomyces sp. JJ66]MBW1603756.1 helicase C-terminal domain-containing protein [Streptomyces sp. JJ66]
MTRENGAPRTLADELRGRPDDALGALLRARPDLLTPVPGDLTQLATRAATRASAARAVERLDRFTLQTAQALAIAPDPCPRAELAALLPGGEEALPGALAALRERALVWGPDEQLRLVRTVRELLTPSASAPSPTGLGPTLAEAASGMSPGRLQELLATAGLPPTHDPVSALSELTGLFTDAERLSALLAQAPDAAREVLAKLTWGPPYGTLGGTGTGTGTGTGSGTGSGTVNGGGTGSASGGAPAAPPVRWLLDRGLLLPSGGRTVVLPREVALHLRGGRAHRELEPAPPPVTPRREHDPGTVDATAAGQVLTALGTVTELLDAWGAAPPPVLRAGGLGVRDLKRTAVSLDLPEPVAAFWIELAYAAGLVASDGETDERYAPTPQADAWLELSPQQRWAALIAAWLPATRVPGLAGTRDGKGRALAALGPGLDRTAAPVLRHRVLELLAALPEGGVPDPADVLARLRWERPLRSADELRATLCAATLTEAELLGVTGRGALASYLRPALTARTSAQTATALGHAAAQLAPLLPEPLDHVLLQADLTAVAPGPLQRPLADTLGVLADVESKGGATVYRFTPGSVRRALDAGRGAADLHAFLAAHSRTPVPQPLTYLIDDVARRHGTLRVGAASAYLRCDDDALLAEILADKRSAPLRLRLLAPTVLASPADPAELLARLRDMGYAPAAESADGDVLIARADAHRTPPRTAPEPVPEGPPRPDDTLLAAAVRAIRAGDLAATAPHRPARPAAAPPGELPRTTSADTLATMQSAVLTGTPVWMGYVNADGAASQRVIAPVRVEGGFVTAYDHTADEVRTFALHRVTGAAELAEPSPGEA